LFPDSVADHYRHTYFEALDLVIHCVQDRFDQPGLKVLRNIEDLIVKAASYIYEYHSEEFLFVTEFYSDDINKDTLKVQLETLKTLFSKQHNDQIRLSHVLDYMHKLPPTLRVIYLNVAALVRILLTMPATNATIERTFSALRRIKTYLRSTMSKTRLNNLMTLHVHKQRTDALDLTKIAEEFVARGERRSCVFRKGDTALQLSKLTKYFQTISLVYRIVNNMEPGAATCNLILSFTLASKLPRCHDLVFMFKKNSGGEEWRAPGSPLVALRFRRSQASGI